MRKIREVLRLKFEAGLGDRKIARAIGSARSTVQARLCRCNEAGLAWPLPEGFDQALLSLGWSSLHLLRVGMQENLCRYGMLLLVMLSFAVAFGIKEAVGGMPLLIAVTHSAVDAALLLLTLVTVYHLLHAPRAAR